MFTHVIDLFDLCSLNMPLGAPLGLVVYVSIYFPSLKLLHYVNLTRDDRSYQVLIGQAERAADVTLNLKLYKSAKP